MKEEFNLCEILKGHEGMKMFSTMIGECIFVGIDEDDKEMPIEVRRNVTSSEWYNKDGRWYKGGEIALYPSRELYLKYPLDAPRAWMEWQAEGGLRIKTWEDLVDADRAIPVTVTTDYYYQTKIERSALALVKIHQVIDAGYGGTSALNDIQRGEFVFGICYDYCDKKFHVGGFDRAVTLPFMFHTDEQAKEFLSHESNRKLLEDFFMV